MSLVHEALQKAEREKQRKTGDSPVFAQRAQPVVAPRPALPREDKPVAPTRVSGFPQAPASPAPAPVARSHQAVLVVVAACVALVAIVAIVFIVNRTPPSVVRKSESSGGQGSVAVASAPARPEPRPTTETFTPPAAATPPAVTTPPADTSQYRVTGIMKDPQGKYCAVINGRVVYVEHYIDGAVVKAIERDRVTLDIGGREAVVRLF